MNFALYTSHMVENSSIAGDAPIVIIGTGPVGIRALQLLVKQNPDVSIVIYGDEPWEPYNRARLSSLLSGELRSSELLEEQAIPVRHNIIQRHNCAVTAINPAEHNVVDGEGRTQKYSRLIIATGSSPHTPNIRGIQLPGVYRLRDLGDVEKLIARRTSSRRAIVLGGGVLGIETALAMIKMHTEVYLIDHIGRLMGNQLDEEAAEMLMERVTGLGIRVCLNTSIKEIIGPERVTSVILRNNIQISCDTVITTAGIRPNVELARAARLSVGRGIRVNDNMRTSDQAIYAIGECAEHRGKLYGSILPCYEQTEAAVACIQGEAVSYKGSINNTQLNVAKLNVRSIGDVNEEFLIEKVASVNYVDYMNGIYRKLVLSRGRLIGAISIGEWPSIGRVEQAIRARHYLWPWQLKRFVRHGVLWRDSSRTEPRQAERRREKGKPTCLDHQ